MSDLAGAYSATGKAWQDGPGRIYDRLAEVVVDACPGGVAGRRVLDLGAGTGAASRAALAAGARSVVAADAAPGMLAHDAGARPPAAAADALALPFAAGAFGAVVAAFSLNHVDDPVAGLVEATRVLAPGCGLVASAYADDDTHPVKAAAEAALSARGWSAPAWYAAVKRDAMPRLATVERAEAACAEAGLADAVVEHRRVAFPELTPDDLVAWRLGMAQMAPFLAALTPEAQAEVTADTRARLGDDPPPLVRSTILLAATTG
jgi:ubiquinone/menaquinone biosynthesis C-methylase UbiE